MKSGNKEGDRMFSYRPRPRRIRPFAIGLLTVAFCYYVYTMDSFSVLSRIGYHTGPQLDLLQDPLSTKELVPLEAHIMSKCPDARDCLEMLVLPTMQQVLDKVNFTLSFIGTYVMLYSLHIPEAMLTKRADQQITMEWLVCMGRESVWGISSSSAQQTCTRIRKYI
jgi:hypothetical protein